MDIDRSQAAVSGLKQTPLPDHFESLNDAYFSLGQSENYYETLASLGEGLRRSVLGALRDIAFNPGLIPLYRDLDVYRDSVRRDISESIITGRYSELAGGRATLTPFAFRFSHPGGNGFSAYSMDFQVEPNSMPPTNLHAIIGRNGVGKTHCLRSMVNAIVKPHDSGCFFSNLDDQGPFPFRRIVSVSFSAFDPFLPIPEQEQRVSSIEVQYIGLKSEIPGTDSSRHAIDSEVVFQSFVDAANKCGQGVRLGSLWATSLNQGHLALICAC